METLMEGSSSWSKWGRQNDTVRTIGTGAGPWEQVESGTVAPR